MEIPSVASLHAYEDSAKLRKELAGLDHGRLLFITADLQMDQLRELDADKAFIVVSPRKNRGGPSFYCIAHADDLELAITVSSRVILGIADNIIVAKANGGFHGKRNRSQGARCVTGRNCCAVQGGG